MLEWIFIAIGIVICAYVLVALCSAF